ncbi:DUF302 domain-containing protein [Leifsonia xyli]|uniref:DUF302 domain-containing protein n=1 Tax=Leifsonia xyli TaxID=1575 RepID=UPI003D670716
MSTPPNPPLGEAWTATRFSLVSELTFDSLVERFEELVPMYPRQGFTDLIARGAPWSEIVDFAESYSELGLLTYWHDSVTEMMSLAGNTAKCAFYFVGNFPVAERMYRHDPRVMNYAPLRMTVTETAGVVTFTTDQPSSSFASFGDPAISAVGAGVDHKVAELLRRLSLPVPAALAPPRV